MANNEKPTADASTVQTVNALPSAPQGSPLKGMTLKGSIFLNDGAYTVAVPGGRNFGGAFHPELETATISGRQIAVSGSYNPLGVKVEQTFEETVKTALLGFLNNPAEKMIQTIAFGGNPATTIRFERESKKSEKSPIASYYISL